MTESAFTFRCSTCGGDARPDIERGLARCSHCGASAQIESALVQRLRTHLETLVHRQSELEEAAGERDRAEREQSRWNMPKIVQFVFPLCAGLWTVLSLGIGGAGMFLVIALTRGHLGEESGGLLAAVTFMGVYAALLGSMRLLIVRRRASLRHVLPSTAAREACPGCGASVPIVTGMTAPCPFCGAALLTSETERNQIEHAALDAVTREQQRARDASRRAVESGAANAQAVLDAVSLATLTPMVFVALPVTLGRAITLGLSPMFWPDWVRDRAVHNQRDIASMVVGGAFAASGIAIGIAVATRRGKTKRSSRATPAKLRH